MPRIVDLLDSFTIIHLTVLIFLLLLDLPIPAAIVGGLFLAGVIGSIGMHKRKGIRMDFSLEELKKRMGKEMKEKRTAICLVKDHALLQECNNEFEQQKERFSKLLDQAQEEKSNTWRKVEKYLEKHDLAEKGDTLMLDDGVIYRI